VVITNAARLTADIIGQKGVLQLLARELDAMLKVP
jgi:hypothetical protein